MSFNGADDHPEPIGPDDPRYYAPRSERRKVNPPSSVAPQTSRTICLPIPDVSF